MEDKNKKKINYMFNSNTDKTLLLNKEQLKQRLVEIPKEPGCYLMKDINDKLLYVGKSKSLRDRVRSYFNKSSDLSVRISLMVRQISEIEIIITDSEAEALTLEANLIKNHQPYFNVLLKDDKKYPYLCITWSEPYPRIFITRRRRQLNIEDRFYGPYVDVTALRKTLFLVKRMFPLRQRPRPLYKDRTCLNYSIGRCPGVCQNLISAKDYQNTLKKVAMIFQGRTNELNTILKKQMQHYSDKMQYEIAATIRDQIKGLELLVEDQKVSLPDSNINRDVIALVDDSRTASIQLFKMREGKLVGRIGYLTSCIGLDKDIILQKIIEEHYSNVEAIEIPPEIVVQENLRDLSLISDCLTEMRGRKVKISIPMRGAKSHLIELVQKNAMHELERSQKGQERTSLELEDLAQMLELDHLPNRIEGYDISHIQGSDAVASQVVFVDGIPSKQNYRKYKIRNNSIISGHSDDYLALREVINRRFRKWSRLKQEGFNFKNISNSVLNTTGSNDWPDLILIDGGKGQLNSVLLELKQLNLIEEVNVCSIAKKHEQIFIGGYSEPINSHSDQLGVMLLRRVRDEAHRFAVSFHRQLRGDRMTKGNLSEIKGLGPRRRKVLLNHFRSVEAIQFATLEQLVNSPGLGKTLANEVWNYFHKDIS